MLDQLVIDLCSATDEQSLQATIDALLKHEGVKHKIKSLLPAMGRLSLLLRLPKDQILLKTSYIIFNKYSQNRITF